VGLVIIDATGEGEGASSASAGPLGADLVDGGEVAEHVGSGQRVELSGAPRVDNRERVWDFAITSQLGARSVHVGERDALNLIGDASASEPVSGHVGAQTSSRLDALCNHLCVTSARSEFGVGVAALARRRLGA